MSAPVIKDSGERGCCRRSPRSTRSCARRCAGSSARRSPPTWTSGRRRASSRGSCSAAAASSGSSGLKFPEEYGGQGGTCLHDAAWIEELARSGSSGGVAARASTPTPRSRCRRCSTSAPRSSASAGSCPGIRGERIGALGITEPDAGSNVAGIRTFARKVPGGYVVNGSKTFITNGVRADFLVCAVKTSPEGGHHGLSFLVLERDMPGYEVTRKLEKMGWHCLRHRRAQLHRRRGAGREPARRARTAASA